jgi:hypothetical protein
MKAVLTTDWTEGLVDLVTGTEVEVVGFVNHSYMTFAVYVDPHGYFAEIPRARLRVKSDEEKAEDAAFTRSKQTLQEAARTSAARTRNAVNAIAGPQTGRGVRRA